ncbi:hypothetical protein Tco_1491215 [Tanacetum coccineum]
MLPFRCISDFGGVTDWYQSQDSVIRNFIESVCEVYLEGGRMRYRGRRFSPRAARPTVPTFAFSILKSKLPADAEEDLVAGFEKFIAEVLEDRDKGCIIDEGLSEDRGALFS